MVSRLDLVSDAAFRFWAQLDCSTSKYLSEMAEKGDWTAGHRLKLDPSNFACARDMAKANAAVAFLKKYPKLPGTTTEQRRAEALRVFHAGEASCYKTNERLSPILISPLQAGMPAQFLRRVRRRLISWLGLGPSDAEMQRFAGHGPGKTAKSAVAEPTAADKFSDPISLTSSCVEHLLNISGTLWMAEAVQRKEAGRDWLDVVRGNYHSTVAKTSVIDRNIAIEPTLNVWFQKAVGRLLRARLLKGLGWNLNTAQSRQGFLAWRGSVLGDLATLDLSNASDTLAKNLVRILFAGTRWLPLFEALRCARTEVDGKWILLEKFSSMGNGFTFELETCVFFALCYECLVILDIPPKPGENIGVFGDDIIVPTDAVSLVKSVLVFAGFEVNEAKSFVDGPFRESCGQDYWRGHETRGYYVKRVVSREDLSTLYSLHNGAKRVFRKCGVEGSPFLEWVLSLIPPRWRRFGPEGLGDAVLHADKKRWRYKWKGGIRWIEVVRFAAPVRVDWRYFSWRVRLACRLHGYGEQLGINTRRVLRCLVIEKVAYS